MTQVHIIAFSFECGGFDSRLMRGGLSPLVWNLARQYASRGHRVSLITPAHGHLELLRERFDIQELDYRDEHTVPLVLDPKVWPDQPAGTGLVLDTRAHLLRLEGVDVYLLSDSHLDLLPDRLYPPPATEGRDLAHFKPLVFQVDGLRFLKRYLSDGPAVVHGFEPAYHYLLPAVLADDDRYRTVSTIAANAPITQKVYRPQVERLLELFEASGPDLDALDGPPPAEDSPAAAMARALAGTRMHVEYGPDYVGVFPLIAADADLVDFVSPGQLDHYVTWEGTPLGALFESLPVARGLRERPDRLLAGGCGIADSWLARDPESVDRAAVRRSLGLTVSGPVFYHAARYAVHHKGQLELMRAVEEVLAGDPELGFVIRCSTGGGDGPAAVANAAFQRLADRHPGQVCLDWRLADEEALFEEAASADFCVFPSKFELDGFLIAQAEAMACGAVPVATAQRVTSHFGHQRPLDAPDATGFSLPGSFRDDDPELARALAERIRHAVTVFRTAPDTYARLSDNARRLSRSFTWGHAADLRLAAYERLLRGEPAPTSVGELVARGWLDALPPTAFAEHRDLIVRAATERGDADALARALGCGADELGADTWDRLFASAFDRADFARCAELALRADRPDLRARLAARFRLSSGPDGVWRVRYAHPGASRVELVVEVTPSASGAGQAEAMVACRDEATVPGPGRTAAADLVGVGPERATLAAPRSAARSADTAAATAVASGDATEHGTPAAGHRRPGTVDRPAGPTPRAALESVAETLASDEPAPSAGGTVLRPLTPDSEDDGVFAGTLDGPPLGSHAVAMVTLRSGRVVWDAVPVRMPAFRLVATDLDGTLLRSDLTVSARTRRALDLVAASGAHHLVVTGRPAVACKDLLEKLGYRGLAVCGQGAQLYDAGTDRLLSSLSLDRDLARSVVERVEAELGRVELGVVTSPPESRFKVTPGFGERVRHGWDVTTDRDLLWVSPIDKLILHHPDVDEDRLAAVTRRLTGGEVTVVHSVKGMVEVLPEGTDKGSGVARAAELLGFTGADAVAFGDMPNDVPLLAWAAHGVAVAGAHHELRAMADEIAPGNDEDGVAAVLERLFAPVEVHG
ncbi:HAD-IIB family hydrolase [Streptomyces sp. SLBN-115]|uniref:HAD-IIB family hydrolase n=1 Tax=Streptomyces sp. SLBN-115 TaxID=2768453 RepID=UPI00116D8D71|nr:HAD-IIB family hydrolase [Streptomyces sp. SLBN-115]TQJ46463.1 Cof subfamily protein (haloacid dehalogenase superfamily)/HAD superfamily hydrolase (TIGR01484 family) [Streptomyces sp. SLBN-115]